MGGDDWVWEEEKGDLEEEDVVVVRLVRDEYVEDVELVDVEEEEEADPPLAYAAVLKSGGSLPLPLLGLFRRRNVSFRRSLSKMEFPSEAPSCR